MEDSDADFEIIRRGLQQSGLRNRLMRCEDGDQALEYLRGDNELPAAILLDLNLPGLDGREVLEEIKKDPELRSIPVIVMTTSNDGRDVTEAYANGANSYVQKPVNLTEFFEALTRLKEYWFEVAILPRSC